MNAVEEPAQRGESAPSRAKRNGARPTQAPGLPSTGAACIGRTWSARGAMTMRIDAGGVTQRSDPACVVGSRRGRRK